MTLILSPAMVSQLEEMLMTKDVWTDPQAPHDSIATCIMPAAQRELLAMTQRAYPYRLAWAAFNPTTNEWHISATPTMRIPNRLARDGWRVVNDRSAA